MNIKLVFAAALMVSASAGLNGQQSDSTLTVLFAGDIMGHDMQIASARDNSTGTYSYD
ncbi:MAG: CapA family protein, partial [Bacteroidia bacterium]